MLTYTLFIVDDEETARNGIALALEKDYNVQGFADAEQALVALKMQSPDLILLDIGLPGMNGIEALEEIKKLRPETVVIMITAFEDIATVVAAMKLGAYDYIVKPVHMDGLMVSLHNALEAVRLRKEVRRLQERYLEENIPCFIGESKSIQNVMEFVDLVARSPDTPVLICGETGTGKELVAAAVHYKSPNFKGPFITLNCAAIPKELIESELFGYEKGAFSGAHEKGKRGLVEEAAGGTLFLDEVGDLGLEAQAKLLRFLEEGEYYRVGSSQKHQVKTRVISATNRDIEQMIEQERFRRDLYYRLAVIKVDIPRLSRRTEDILPIARHFMYVFSAKFGKDFTGITPEAEQELVNRDWKGNVRELRNVIERAVLTGYGPLLEREAIQPLPLQAEQTALLPVGGTGALALNAAGIDLPATLKAIEKNYFDEALRLSGGKESEAARLLNLNYYTFRHRRKKLYEE